MLLKVFRPNLIDYINLSKVLDNYTRRCKWNRGYTTEDGIGLWRGGGHQFFSEKHF